MRAEIKKLHQRLGKTMVYVTHDQTEAMTMADQIVVLNGGRIEQAGPPLELYENPRNLFVASFIGSPEINLISGHVQDRTLVLSDGLVLPLPASASYANGRALTYGIRPNHIGLRERGIAAEVLVVEPTGDAQQVQMAMGEAEVQMVLYDTALLRPGAHIMIGWDPEKVLLFDTESGARLT